MAYVLPINASYILPINASVDLTVTEVTPVHVDTTWDSRHRWNELKNIANVSAKITSLNYIFQPWYITRHQAPDSDVLVIVRSYASALGRACQLLSTLDITSIGRSTIQPVSDCCWRLHEWMTVAARPSEATINPGKASEDSLQHDSVECLLNTGMLRDYSSCMRQLKSQLFGQEGAQQQQGSPAANRVTLHVEQLLERMLRVMHTLLNAYPGILWAQPDFAEPFAVALSLTVAVLRSSSRFSECPASNTASISSSNSTKKNDKRKNRKAQLLSFGETPGVITTAFALAHSAVNMCARPGEMFSALTDYTSALPRAVGLLQSPNLHFAIGAVLALYERYLIGSQPGTTIPGSSSSADGNKISSRRSSSKQPRGTDTPRSSEQSSTEQRLAVDPSFTQMLLAMGCWEPDHAAGLAYLESVAATGGIGTCILSVLTATVLVLGYHMLNYHQIGSRLQEHTDQQKQGQLTAAAASTPADSAPHDLVHQAGGTSVSSLSCGTLGSNGSGSSISAMAAASSSSQQPPRATGNILQQGPAMLALCKVLLNLCQLAPQADVLHRCTNALEPALRLAEAAVDGAVWTAAGPELLQALLLQLGPAAQKAGTSVVQEGMILETPKGLESMDQARQCQTFGCSLGILVCQLLTVAGWEQVLVGCSTALLSSFEFAVRGLAMTVPSDKHKTVLMVENSRYMTADVMDLLLDGIGRATWQERSGPSAAAAASELLDAVVGSKQQALPAGPADQSATAAACAPYGSPAGAPSVARQDLKQSQQRRKHITTLLISIYKLRNTWRTMSVFKLGWEEAVATAHGVELMQSVLMSYGCWQDSSSGTDSSSIQSPGTATTSHSSSMPATDVANVAVVVGRCCLLISSGNGMCPVAVEQWGDRLSGLAECICCVGNLLNEHTQFGCACSSNAAQITDKSRKPASHALKLQKLQQQLLDSIASKYAELCGSSDAVANSQAPDRANTASSSSSSGSRSAAGDAVPDLVHEAEVITCDLARLLQQFGEALCGFFPVDLCCNNPHCSNLSSSSEYELVSGKGSRCSGCKVARYCCKDCQVAHWEQHKAACKRLAAAEKATNHEVARAGCGLGKQSGSRE